MKKKHILFFALAIIILSNIMFAHSEGLLPSIDEVFDVEIPYISDYIWREPDKRDQLEDGTNLLYFSNFNEADYQQVSITLENDGCKLADYTVENGVIKLIIEKQGKHFYLEYDTNAKTAIFRLPPGIVEETPEVSELRKKMYFGFNSMDITKEDVKNGFPSEGLLIVSVDENSPMSRANLIGGDLIVSIDGKKIKSQADFEDYMKKKKKGKSVKFKVIRADSFELNYDYINCDYSSNKTISAVVQPDYFDEEE